LATDPSADLEQHPTSVTAQGDDMLVTLDVPLEFIGEMPVGWSVSGTSSRKTGILESAWRYPDCILGTED